MASKEEDVTLNLWFIYPLSESESESDEVNNAPPTVPVPAAAGKKRKTREKDVKIWHETKGEEKKEEKEEKGEIKLLEEQEGPEKLSKDDPQVKWMRENVMDAIVELDKLGIQTAMMSYGDCTERYPVLLLPSGNLLQVSKNQEMDGPGCFHLVGSQLGK